MAIRSQQVTVGGREFSLSQLPAKRGLRLFNRLCRVLVPPAARALAGTGAKSLKALLSADLRGVADGVVLLFEKLTEDEQESILAELFEGARIKLETGKWAPLAEVYDDAFAGRIDEVYLLAVEALKLNFASFSHALNAAFSAAATEAAEPTATA